MIFSKNLANRRVAFDFQQYNEEAPLNFPLGLEIDTDGLLYTTQPQAVWVIDPTLVPFFLKFFQVFFFTNYFRI